MKNRLFVLILSFLWIGFLSAQSFAGYLNLAPEALSEKLKEPNEQAGVVLSTLASLQEKSEKEPENAEVKQAITAQLAELGKIYGVELALESLSWIDIGGKRVLQVSYKSPEGLTPIIPERGIVGTANIAAVISQGPGKSGSAYGEHDVATIDYVKSLLPNARPLSDGEKSPIETALNALNTAHPEVILLAVPGAPPIQTFSDVAQILKDVLIVKGDAKRFLVNFVTLADGHVVPVIEENFLAAHMNDPEFLARILMHEDLEPRVKDLLVRSKITDIHPHDVVAAVQEDLAGKSLVGKPNADYDRGLLHRDSVGVLEGQDSADAHFINEFEKLSPELQSEIKSVAGEAVKAELGVSTVVTPTAVTVGGVALSKALADAVRASGLARDFTKGLKDNLDLTFSHVVKFLTRAVIIAGEKAFNQFENKVSAVKISSPVTDAPKAAIFDVDSLLEINYGKLLNADGSINQTETGRLELDNLVVGVNRALAAKLKSVQAQKGNLKVFVTSSVLPQEMLDYVVRQLDTGVNSVPAAVSYDKTKGVEDLISKVSEKFGVSEIKADDVLFYGTPDNVKALQSDAYFRTNNYYKVIKVEKAGADERVSMAKLTLGFEWLYMPEAQAKDVTLVKQLLDGIIAELVKSGEISAEEAAQLNLEARDGILVMPPVKADMGQQIQDAIRSSTAAAKFA